MPSNLHEVLVEMFRHRPALAVELLTGALGQPLPPFDQVRVDAGELTDVAPTEYRADAVVVLTERGAPALAAVVEVQLRRDPVKRWSWPVYVATLRARMRWGGSRPGACVERAARRTRGRRCEPGHLVL